MTAHGSQGSSLLASAKAVVEDQAASAEIHRSVLLGEGSHACCVFFEQAKTMLVHQVDPVVACLQIHVVMPALSRFGVCHTHIRSALEGFDDVVDVFGFDMLHNLLAMHKVNSSLHV